jgi:phage-related protein
MKNQTNAIVEFIKRAFSTLRNIIRAIVHGILNFVAHVVNWFKSLALDKEKDIPFIADADKIKDMLKTAPVKNVGIFEGVYDEDADEITSNRFVDADSLDEKTKEVLGNEPLVVLN